MNIKIDYNGAYPSLCSGHLKITIDGKLWDFGEYCLMSGGSAYIGADGREVIEEGDWSVNFPDNFPPDEKLRSEVLKAINEQIPHGCCGGCI